MREVARGLTLLLAQELVDADRADVVQGRRLARLERGSGLLGFVADGLAPDAKRVGHSSAAGAAAPLDHVSPWDDLSGR